MKLAVSNLIVISLISVATTAPLDNPRTTAAAADVIIPPYMKKIYNKMTQALNQDDQGISAKYLSSLQTIHWLDPIHVTTAAASSGSYQHQYTATFSIRGLPEHPNYIELFLHVQTEASPAEIKITSEHIQEPVVWTQRLPKDDSKISKVQLARISLNSLAASSLWENNSSVTLTAASTHALRTPSKNHYQNGIGLVLYMGGAPEEIEELLDTSIVSSGLKKHAYSIGAVAKRTAAKRSGSTPCQKEDGLKVTLTDLPGEYANIVTPKTVDIGKCKGDCPHFLHPFHNPSRHAEVRNFLAFREGSASSKITTASCVPTSFKNLPTLTYNKESNSIVPKIYDNMMAASCGCR